MKLIKKTRLAVAATLALCAGAALADYNINWRIDDSSPYSFGYAMIKSQDGAGNVAYLNQSDRGVDTGVNMYLADSQPGTSVYKDDVTGVSSLGATLADNHKYSFQVELYAFGEAGGADSLLALTDFASWDSLVSGFDCLNDDSMALKGSGVWVVSGFHAVPEPTSGLLLLLGVAGLALKRKRA